MWKNLQEMAGWLSVVENVNSSSFQVCMDHRGMWSMQSSHGMEIHSMQKRTKTIQVLGLNKSITFAKVIFIVIGLR